MRALKAIEIAAAVFIAVALITIVSSIYHKGLKANQDGFSESLDVMISADASSLEKYSGKTIYGSEVKYLLKSDAKFEISTEKYAALHPDDEYFSDFTQINNAAGTTYVDQSAMFKVSIIQNKDGAFLGLRFKEVKDSG